MVLHDVHTETYPFGHFSLYDPDKRILSIPSKLCEHLAHALSYRPQQTRKPNVEN